MRIKIDRKKGEWSEYFASQAGYLGDAADAAVLSATDSIKALGRTQVSSALSPRSANTFSSMFFTNTRDGGDRGLAGYVYGRWWRKGVGSGRPVDILAEFETGATITPKRGEALAIPIPANAGKFGIGLNSGRSTRLTPLSFEQRTGLELKYIERPGKNPLLVTDGTRAPQDFFARGKKRRFRKRRAGTAAQQANPIPIFVLVRTSRLPKRLDFSDIRDRAGPDRLMQAMLIQLGKRYG